MSFDVERIREDFQFLEQKIIYMDTACMSLKPRQVVDKVNEYYNQYPGCAARSAHRIADKVEVEVGKTRHEFRKFLNAKNDPEIIFTRNTTESLNLVANTLGLKEGDEVILSDKEHNSNLVPWLKMKREGIKVVIASTNDDGTFNMDNFASSFTDKTKLVSMVHSSNLDGVSNPIREIAKITHHHNALLMVDAAQSVPHKEVDVKYLGVDFLACSGHKMLGPTGIGVLYGRKKLLEELDQFIVGGHTVIDTTLDSYVPEELPSKFEAGLQDYSGIIGLSEACKYLKKIGLKKIGKHELELNKIITEGLGDCKEVKLLGPAEPEQRGGLYSFTVEGKDIHHVSKMLDVSANIMTRSGAHCVHSWFNKHNMKGSVRASLYLYNTEEEASRLVDEVKKIANL